MTRSIRLSLNRVEGDLELKLDLENGRVADARCVGSLYRGFEQILVGRPPMDALAITPRVCGICGTAHLMAAAQALEKAFALPVPANATRVRNLCLMAEEVQSDWRQTFLMFCVDLARDAYVAHPGHAEVVAAFAEMEGALYRQAVRHSKEILRIVALFGGQWPHSSYMVPGGVTTLYSARRLEEAEAILDGYVRWYEEVVLGGSLEAWLALDSAAAFESWITAPERRGSAVALFTRACREAGLDRVGAGIGLHLSYGAHPDPEDWRPPYDQRACLRPAGLFDAANFSLSPFDPLLIAEDISHSWYHGDQATALHPSQGETRPKYQPGERYSWAKAPRYDGRVAQTGPMAQILAAGDPLLSDLLKVNGSSAWLRQLTRLHRPASTLVMMRATLRDLAAPANAKAPYILPAELGRDGEGHGLVEAARGGLGHWVRIRNGQIESYQIISPTTWNASPRDHLDRRGPWEESLIGLAVEDEEDPLLVGHVIRSHDPCLVCTVHFVKSGTRLRLGGVP